MPTHPTSRIRPHRHFRPLLALGFAVSATRLARAATLSSVPECRAAGGGWSCYLPGILSFLSAIAIVLGIILVGVVALAVKIYLNTKHNRKVDS